MIAAILERDPPALSATVPATPALLDRVVRKCLAKDPDARWQSAADLRDELQWIAEGADQGLPAAVAPHRQVWRDRLLGAGAVAAIAAAATLAWRPWRATAPAAQPRHLELTIPRLAANESLALSPDGSQLAFITGGASGAPSVWVRSLATAAVRPIVGTERASRGAPPFWSPDGRRFAFLEWAFDERHRDVCLASLESPAP